MLRAKQTVWVPSTVPGTADIPCFIAPSVSVDMSEKYQGDVNTHFRPRAAKKERPPGGGLSGVRSKHHAFKTASKSALIARSNGYFFFAVFFAFFAFFAFLAMFPSVIPKAQCKSIIDRHR
jgi:hypothetical protein